MHQDEAGNHQRRGIQRKETQNQARGIPWDHGWNHPMCCSSAPISTCWHVQDGLSKNLRSPDKGVLCPFGPLGADYRESESRKGSGKATFAYRFVNCNEISVINQRFLSFRFPRFCSSWKFFILLPSNPQTLRRVSVTNYVTVVFEASSAVHSLQKALGKRGKSCSKTSCTSWARKRYEA